MTCCYITDRALPDKAIDAMDEAGARMHLAGSDTPKFVVEKEHEIEKLRGNQSPGGGSQIKSKPFLMHCLILV